MYFFGGGAKSQQYFAAVILIFVALGKSVALEICSFQASLGKTHIRAKDSNCLLFRERKLVGTPLLMQMLLSAAAFHCG